MRAEPSLNGAVLGCIAEGTTVGVLDGTRFADGHAWQLISALGRSGWAVEQYLRAASSGAVTPAPAPAVASAPAAASLSGSLPASGGFGIAVWSGGTLDALLAAASDTGCYTRSVWANRSGGGDFVGYIVGAPGFVNAAWQEQYPGALGAGTPVIVVCAGAEPSPTSSPSSNTSPAAAPLPPPSIPPGVPASPPGPAGNA